MVEKVALDIRTCFPDSFGFDQNELVMKQVKMKMKVDPISLLEQERFKYEEDEDGNSFPKWFSYM